MNRGPVQRSVAIILGLDSGLAAAGLFLHPAVWAENGLIGATANVVILALCGYLFTRTPGWAQVVSDRTWRLATRFGIAVGIWLGTDILLNYVIYRDGATNQKISFVVYGLYLAVMMVVSFLGAATTGRMRDGLVAAIHYVIPAQGIWYLAEFLSFYTLGSTAGGRRFLHEEMQQDFERSGSRSFEAFTMGDFYGAGFLHILVLGFLVALLFGSLANVAGAAWFRYRRI
jgi:hypothetical protein